jgi:predicted RNA-binding Zn-ribbon protein involved in translation (DUF1610 family)
MSDVNVYSRGAPMLRQGNAPDHPLARCVPDTLLSESRFQDVGCPHCQRVRQDSVWYYRCGKCRTTTLFYGCVDCGSATGARDRYDAHGRVTHGL